MSTVIFQVRIEYEIDVLANPEKARELDAFIEKRVRSECAKLKFPYKNSYTTKVLPTDYLDRMRVGRQDVEYGIDGEVLEAFAAERDAAAGSFFAKRKLKAVYEKWDVPTE